MKTLSLEKSTSALADFKKATVKGHILLTHRGKPIAYILPTAFYDEEDLGYMTDPQFWRMVREWRKDKGAGIPLEEIESRIGGEEHRRRNGRNSAKKTGKRYGSPRSK